MDKTTSEIKSAHCECPAGLGPHGSCKHIAAFCYALESFSCLQYTEFLWNQPQKRHLDPSIVNYIEFAQHEYGKIKRKQPCSIYDPRSIIYNNLLHHKENAAILHVMSSANEGNATSYPPPTSL